MRLVPIASNLLFASAYAQFADDLRKNMCTLTEICLADFQRPKDLASAR